MHVPVLLHEVLEYLRPQEGDKFIDATVGGGGHTRAILHINKQAKVLGIDLDQASLSKLKQRIVQEGLDQRCTLKLGNFKDLDLLAQDQGFSQVDGILLDIGFSSLQLDDPLYGLSFQQQGPLDMRFSRDNPLTADRIVNQYSPQDLERVIHDFGEENLARRITSKIVESRKKLRITTTLELAEIIRNSVPKRIQHKANDSVRRVFQAIRIEVNGELENLKQALPKALDLLKPGGRLVVIVFHSLEDRIVKRFFLDQAKDCICPNEFPMCVCGKTQALRILTRKPVQASEREIHDNSRSKSAKLRAIQKI